MRQESLRPAVIPQRPEHAIALRYAIALGYAVTLGPSIVTIGQPVVAIGQAIVAFWAIVTRTVFAWSIFAWSIQSWSTDLQPAVTGQRDA
ncbi:MAG: hypothetical protein AAF515_19375 [Pseudomonadota bacterium]